MKKKRLGRRHRLIALMMSIVLAAACFVLPPVQQVFAKTAPSDVLEKYSSKSDIATKIYPKREAATMGFTGTEFDNDSYNLTFTAKYNENEEATYEGLRFVVATAQEVVKGRKVDIHLNVRDNNLFVFARPQEGGSEAGIFYGNTKGKKGEDNTYAIRYEKGKIWLFENDELLLDGLNLAGNDIVSENSERYCNIEPKIMLTNEACEYAWYSNLRLWGKGVKYTGEFPAMPEGNGDYAPTMGIKPFIGASTEWENGVLKNTQVCNDLVQFKRLPFGEKDTYAWSFDVTVEEADEPWKCFRPIIRGNKDFTEYYQLLFLNGTVALDYHNAEAKLTTTIATAGYTRKLGKTDKIGLVVGPDSMSLWINGAMVMQNVKLEHQVPSYIGMKYEGTKATISDMSFYFTEKTPYVKPDGDPTIPVLTKDMYNAAQYMIVKGANGPVSYQNCRIKKEELHYEFSNIPVSEYGEYVFRANVTQYSEWTEPWKGTRLKFRTGDAGDYYIFFLENAISIAGVEDANYPINIEVGKTYDIAIWSDATTVTVWLDGKLIFERVPLTENGAKTKPAPGIWFELCEATVENMQIYGKDVIFTDETFDVALMNNKWFNITTVPEMPAGAVNYFDNVKLGSGTNMDCLPTYEHGVFKNQFADAQVPIVFVDQAGSNNLNGLKNSDTYVWSAKVKANGFHPTYKNDQGEVVKDAGIGFVFKEMKHPGNGYVNRLTLHLLQDRIELRSYKDSGMDKCYTDNEFQLEIGKEYKVDMLIGSGWAKVWIDNRLIFTTYDLATYNLAFQFELLNSQMEVHSMKVYTVEAKDAKILDVTTEKTAVKAGNTIKDMDTTLIPLSASIWRTILGSILFALPIIGVISGAVLYRKKKEKKEAGTDEKAD